MQKTYLTHCEFTFEPLPQATCWLSLERPNTRIAPHSTLGYWVPKVRTEYGDNYEVIVQLDQTIAPEGLPLNPRQIANIRLELRIRALLRSIQQPLAVFTCMILALALLLGPVLNVFADGGNDLLITATSAFSARIISALGIFIIGAVVLSVFRFILAEITMFKPSLYFRYEENGLSVSLLTAVEHSVNERAAINTSDLQRLASPIRLVIHAGDSEQYTATLRALEASMDNYICIPAPGHTSGVFRVNNTTGAYERQKPPFLEGAQNWAFDHIDYAREGKTAYRKYCVEFAKRVGIWADKAVLTIGNTTGEQIARSHIRANSMVIGVLILLMLSTTAAFANKAEQVIRAVGNEAHLVPKDGEKTVFFFSGKTLTRYGNAKSTCLELLVNAPGYDSTSNIGDFRTLQIGSASYHTQVRAAESGDPVRPRPLFPERVPSCGGTIMLPDSMTIAQSAIETVQHIEGWKASMIRPGGFWWWVRAVFWSVFSMLMLPAAWLWLAASISGEESNSLRFYKDTFAQIHEASSVGFFFIIAIPVAYVTGEWWVINFIGDWNAYNIVAFALGVGAIGHFAKKIIPNLVGKNSNTGIVVR